MRKNITALRPVYQSIIVGLALLLSVSTFTGTARADFLGCAISGANIGDCLNQESEDQTSFT
ncbi:MAG TPA: hypothetical protein PKA32_03440, partial [Candidatus Gracilibacteria bacterium]|nr:hypothetical protein [Candidatus Gracilibacteria bacterium]